MVTNTFLLNARHPMRFLPRDNNVYLAQDGVTEILGTGYQDKRRWYVTVLDPFDFAGVFKGRSMEKRFWETHEHGRITKDGREDDVERANGKASEVVTS